MNTASAQLAPVLAAGGPLMAHLLERTEARLEQVAGGHGPKLGCHAAGTLAGALPEVPYACGLGTAALLARDLTDDPLVPRDGALTVRRPEPSEALLDAARVEPSDDFVPLELLRRARAAAG